MRKGICLLLGIILLLTGCSDVNRENESSNQETMQNSSQESSKVDLSEIPKPTIPISGRKPTATLDVPKDLEIVYYNKCDYSAYANQSDTYSIFVLSRYPIAKEEITVESVGPVSLIDERLLDVQGIDSLVDGVCFFVQGGKVSLTGDWESDDAKRNRRLGNFYVGPEAVYLTEAGIDWAKANELKLAYEEAVAVGESAVEEQRALQEYFQDYMAFYEEDMKELQENPGFYVYQVKIWFESVKKMNTLETIQLRVENEVFELNIGQIRIYSTRFSDPATKEFDDVDNKNKGIQVKTESKEYSFCPWQAARYKEMKGGFSVKEDSVLKRFYVLSGEEQGAYVSNITMIDRETGEEIGWDGASDVAVEAEQRFALCYEVDVPELEGELYWNWLPIQFVLEYETEDGCFQILLEEEIYFPPGWYELCKIWLDGISMEEYYTTYKWIDSFYQQENLKYWEDEGWKEDE